MGAPLGLLSHGVRFRVSFFPEFGPLLDSYRYYALGVFMFGTEAVSEPPRMLSKVELFSEVEGIGRTRSPSLPHNTFTHNPTPTPIHMSSSVSPADLMRVSGFHMSCGWQA